VVVIPKYGPNLSNLSILQYLFALIDHHPRPNTLDALVIPSMITCS